MGHHIPLTHQPLKDYRTNHREETTTMNQTEATQQIADTLSDGMYLGSVTIGRPVEHDGPDVILVSYDSGLIASVTVEILAQP